MRQSFKASWQSQRLLLLTVSASVFFGPAAAVRPLQEPVPVGPNEVVKETEEASGENESLFANVPEKLTPMLGYEPPLWKVEAGIIGAIVVVLLSILLCTCRAKSGEPARAVVIDEKPKEDEGGELTTDQKLSKLKKDKTKHLLHQALEKQKLEKTLQAINRLEAEKNQEEPEDPETIKQKAEDALQAADMTVNKNLTTALAYLMPMAVQSQRIYDAIDQRSKKAQEQVVKLAMEQVKDLTKDMTEIFDMQDIQGQIFKAVAEIDTPSLATIVASAFAPSQLRMLHLSNMLSAAVALTLAVIDSLVLLTDRGTPCHTYVAYAQKEHWMLVDLWFQVDLGVSSFCFLVRLCSFKYLGRILEDLDSVPAVEVQDDPVKALRLLLAYYLNTGTEALARVDAISGSYLYALANMLVVFNLIWISLASEVVLNTPWNECSNPGNFVLRARFLLFLIFLVPNLLSVVTFFVGRFLSGERLQVSLLMAADKADKGLGIGLPLCSVLVQAFFIRNKRDMINIQVKLLQMRKDEAEKARLEAEKELDKLKTGEETFKTEVSSMEEKLKSEASKGDNDLMKEHEEKKTVLLNEAEEVFGMLNERAKKASQDAKLQVEQWEEGEGGELLQAMSRGEGLDFMKKALDQKLKEVDIQQLASDYSAQASEMAAGLNEQEWVKQAKLQASEVAKKGEEAYNSKEFQEALASGSERLEQAKAGAMKSAQDAYDSQEVQQALASSKEQLQQAASASAEAMAVAEAAASSSAAKPDVEDTA